MEAIGFIGFGGIAESVLTTLKDEVEGELNIAGILVREANGRPEQLPFIADLAKLINRRPRVIAECASHEAVRSFGEDVLRSGVDLIVVSTGALADSALHDRLKTAAYDAGSKLILPSGAIGALDALSAARLGGLERVRYRSRKPAQAWKGTPAEDTVNLDQLTTPQVIYQGTARQAALLYPKNSNSAAAVALAGLGFEDTEVELVADPTVSCNIHEIDVQAKSGSFLITLSGKPSSNNPRTSMLTAYSVARALLSYDRPVVI